MVISGFGISIEKIPPVDGGGYMAIAPQLPGCVADGDTPEEALAAMKNTIEAWLATAKSLGWVIPGCMQSTQVLNDRIA